MLLVRCVLLVMQVVAFAAVVASAALAEEAQAPAAQTYVLTRVVATRELFLRKVLLRNDTTGKDLTLKGRGVPLLIAAEPGAYYLRRVDTRYQNMNSLHIPKPEQPFQVEAGMVNYLGDLVLTFNQSPGLSLNWNFVGNRQTMRAAYVQNRELFHASPLVELRPFPGYPPVYYFNLDVLFDVEPRLKTEDAPEASP